MRRPRLSQPPMLAFRGVARLVAFRGMGLGFIRRARAGTRASMPRGASQARKATTP